VVVLLRPVAAEHGIELLAHVPTQGCGHVRADRTRLRQVLLNLVSNAIKYNREGGFVRLTCGLDGNRVRLSVTDSGPGLSAEQQARLFRDFERLDADQSDVQGTGIGLALSRRLMSLMQGDIGVTSEPGQGSTFWLRLDRAESQRATSPVALAPAAAPPTAAADPAAPRHVVLYIEDNPANVALMEGALHHRSDIRLLHAPKPALGLELARTERPSLVLLDIQLPGMDGYEVLRRLRMIEALRAVPVVAISANAMPSDLARGRAAGFNDYLTKPLDLARLQAVVDAALKG
jgi:CheY-like chemotaxis protein/anti-sigma regulatory factor (Ser/Thr protein kinase)